ncbi:MAG: hypothetical protein ABR956_13860 [Terracidiphilus sp.]|jgi:hypothetical protein
MKKFLFATIAVFCLAMPYAAQAQVVVAIGHHHHHHHHHHHYHHE